MSEHILSGLLCTSVTFFMVSEQAVEVARVSTNSKLERKREEHSK